MKHSVTISILVISALLVAGLLFLWLNRGQKLMLRIYPAKDSDGRIQLEVFSRGYDGRRLRLADFCYTRRSDGSTDKSYGESISLLRARGSMISVNDVGYPEQGRWHVPFDEWISVLPGDKPLLVYTGRQKKDNRYEYYIQVK